MEALQVDATAPKVKVLEAPISELLIKACAADEGACGGAVEAPKPGVAHFGRYRPARS
jgi:hypothetical protein